LQATHSHRPVPSVKRTEYLFDFLEVIRIGYSRETVEAKLADRKRSFEIEKARALGRGRPFTSRMKKASGLARFCQEMSRHTGLIETADGSYRLTNKGERLLQMALQGQETDAPILKLLLEVYPSFLEIVTAIDSANGDEIILPLTRSKEIFSEAALPCNILVDLWGFAIVRDLCSQLGVLNWFPEILGGVRVQRVFTTCTIRELVEPQILHSADYAIHEVRTFPIVVMTRSGSHVVIDRNEAAPDRFREVLWSEYLKTTNYVPRKPVFYSNLRSKVCHALRIPDKEFDRLTRTMMEKDDKYLLIAAGGSLPFSRDSAGMLKSLPPQSTRGEYIVYLKMDEKTQ
jgi:hypothetical protein